MATTGSRVLDDIAEVIGEAAALELAWAFRGEMLYIPKDPATEPLIARAIGQDAAGRLCEVFFRTTCYMPFTTALARKVAALEQAGRTRKQIARELHIAERRVYRILEGAQAGADGDSARGAGRDFGQLGLFDPS